MPRTGNRFAGIYTFYDNRSIDDYREYLQVKLTTPLIPNEYYCAEFYATGAEIPLYYSNNIGMYFHAEPIYEMASSQPLNFSPQILTTEIIADTSKWIKIGTNFKAVSSAQYLTLGNFSDDDQTQTLFHGPHNDNYYAYAYYFIDDISVEKLPYDGFTFSGDTIICQGENTILGAWAGVDNVSWTTLSDTATVVFTGASFSATSTETISYRVTARGCGKTVVDTVTLTVNPKPDVFLGNDTTICVDSNLVLHAGNIGASYKWQDLSAHEYFKVFDAGTYSVEVSNVWDCFDSDEIHVYEKHPPVVDIGADTLVCGAVFFSLDANNEGANYEWSTGSSEASITPTSNGQYWVNVKNSCGTATDTITINSSYDVIITNIVTLNNDNKNETVKIKVLDEDLFGALRIFDRWGGSVFVDNNYSGQWPNASNVIPSGTYYYIFEYPGCPIFKGWIHLVNGR
jgi:gliding motility-associated-like protein